jgi:Na+/alanine symporter
MSSLELVLFSFARTGRNERRQETDLIRVAAWLIVSVLLAYVYAAGMLGSSYVKAGLRVSFGERIDYVLALAWLIGAFYVISSYIFYAKEMMLVFADDELYVEKGAYFRVLMYGLVFTGTLFFVCCFHYDVVRPFLVNALLYADVPLSLAMPLILICIVRKKSSQRTGR